MDTLHPDDWRELTASQRDLLIALAIDNRKDRQPTGAELNDRLGRMHERRNATHRDLTTLRELGYVDAEEAINERGRPKRNELTEDGHQLLIDALPTYHRAQVAIAP